MSHAVTVVEDGKKMCIDCEVVQPLQGGPGGAAAYIRSWADFTEGMASL